MMEEEIEAALAVSGTVATTPPHLGVGTTVTEPATSAPASSFHEFPPASDHAAETLQKVPTSSALKADHDPESLTDAGIRPA